MGSLVTLRSFKSQPVNGEDFTLNPSDDTPNLVGGVAEFVQATHRIQMFWNFEADSTNTVAFDVVALLGTFTKAFGSFEDDGFIVGHRLNWSYSAVPAGFDGTVQSVSGGTMIVLFDGGVPDQSGPASTTSAFNGITPYEDLEYSFGLIGNSEGTNYVSKLDGSNQRFYADGIGFDTGGGVRDLNFVNMTPSGINQSWRSGTVKARFIQDVGFKQEFEVVHEFLILPFYTEGEQSNVANENPPSLFSSSTLKYVHKADFFTVLSNPNSIISAVDDQQLGSVGYFGENYNGFQNDYTVASIVYTDDATAQVINEINPKVTTKVVVRVTNPNNPFTATTKGVLGVSLLAEAARYQGNTNTVQENFMFDQKLQEEGSPPVSSTIINDLTITLIGAGEIEIEADLIYSVPQQNDLTNNDTYAIWLHIQDDSQSNAVSDRVPLVLDSRNFDIDLDVPDLLFPDEINSKIIPHDKTESDFGFTNLAGWNEEGFQWNLPFYINVDLAATLTALNVSLVAYNSTTGDLFKLQQYNFNVGTPIVSGGVQQLNVSTDRGFNLLSGSIFNDATIENVGPSIVSAYNVEEYLLNVGFKINFEEWFAQPDADQIFYNANEQLDGLNKLTSNYSLKNGYAIKVAMDAEMSDGSTSTDYRFLSADFDIQDYDFPQPEPLEVNCKIVTYDQNANNLDGGFSDTENTIIEATFTYLTMGAPDANLLYGWIGLDILNGSINTIYELSTLNAPATVQPLVPLPAESLTKITSLGSTVTLECEVDFTQIDQDKGYCISAHLREKNPEIPIVSLITNITASFTGGPTGSWDMLLLAQDGDTNPLPNGYNARFSIKIATIEVGTFDYLIGDVIGVNAPQATTGIGAAMITYMSGTVTDGATITFDKRDWAEAECIIRDALNTTSSALEWCFSVDNGVVFSNVSNDTQTIVSTISAFEFPNVGKRVDGSTAVFADRTNDKIRLINTDGYTKTVGTQASLQAVGIDYGDVSNGQPVILSVQYIGIATVPVLFEYRYDGKNYTPTSIKTMTKLGAFRIGVDPNKTYLGKSAIWTGHARGNTTVPNRGFERLTLLEWDGITYIEHDFQPVIEAIFLAHAPTDTNLTINNIIVDDNSDIYIVWRSLNTTNNGLFRLRLTGATYENPADWSFKLMTGVASGNSDGTGSGAQTSNLRGIGIIGYDGVLNQATGTNPEFVIADALPNIGGIRTATHAVGPDEYTTTKTIGGTTLGDLDGTGTAARFDLLRDSIGLNLSNKALALDSANQAVYLLDMVANTSTKIGGQNSAGDEEQIEY